MTTPPSATARQRRGQQAWARGARAETLCRWWLRLKGYRILARDWRVKVGEIDLIARRGRLLIFVEVKARWDFATAAESISRHQRQRITRAARAFLATRPELGSLDIRFDVMLVSPMRPPRHITDAWREGWS